jgi:excisionase family DNA binding protein
MTDDNDHYLTAKEVMAAFKVGKTTVYRWAETGAMPSLKICGKGMFPASILDKAQYIRVSDKEGN